MMLYVEVWDEVSPINGVDAEVVFNNRDDLANARGDIFLVKNGDIVQQIEIGSIIRANYGFESDMPIQEVAEQYLLKREEEEVKVKNENLTMMELQEQIAMLSYQVMMLSPNEGDGVNE